MTVIALSPETVMQAGSFQVKEKTTKAPPCGPDGEARHTSVRALILKMGARLFF